MMETVSTSETSFKFHQITRWNNPEDSHHRKRRENLRSHKGYPDVSQTAAQLSSVLLNLFQGFRFQSRIKGGGV
jgi:hypothetical protein